MAVEMAAGFGEGEVGVGRWFGARGGGAALCRGAGPGLVVILSGSDRAEGSCLKAHPAWPG